ncbi:MAG: four helix bundle protein [Chitinophagaceae bacterium]|nr:MAG: four helix bundle protein [Chitinophagaceae bacterium]
METVRSFEDLECWKACTDFRRYVRSLIRKFPAEEKYELISQMRRASRSATNNIAEGYGRFHFKENAQFCRQSRGSLYELKDDFIIVIALDEGYISQSEFDEGVIKYEKSLLLLNGYINYLVKADNAKSKAPTINQ